MNPPRQTKSAKADECFECPLLKASGISGVSLRDLFEARLEALEKAIHATKESQDLRMESMNEFRRQIERERTDFVPRNEYGIAIGNAEKQIQGLQIAQANQAGKASMTSVYAAIVVGVVSLFSSIGAWIQMLLEKP